MRWKPKGNWNGAEADDISLHTHSFSFGLNHYWPLKVSSNEEKWEKGPYLKKPSVPDLLTYIFGIVIHFRIDWLKRIFGFLFSIRGVVRMWGWNWFNNLLNRSLPNLVIYFIFVEWHHLCFRSPFTFQNFDKFYQFIVRQKKILPSSWKVFGSNITFSSIGFVVII